MMKKSTIILILAIVFSNAAWLFAYNVSNVGYEITMTYHNASLEYTEKMLDQALVVANENVIGKSLSSAKEIIKLDSYDSEPFVKNDCLYAAGLCLKIGENNIILSVGTD